MVSMGFRGSDPVGYGSLFGGKHFLNHTGMTNDEAVSLMGAVLPHLERWNATHVNDARS